MDRQSEANVMQALNHFAVATYVQQMLVAKYQKITLFSVLPYSGAPNLSEATSLLMIQDFPSLFSLFGKNAAN